MNSDLDLITLIHRFEDKEPEMRRSTQAHIFCYKDSAERRLGVRNQCIKLMNQDPHMLHLTPSFGREVA